MMILADLTHSFSCILYIHILIILELNQARIHLLKKHSSNFVLLILACLMGFMRPRPEVNKHAARQPLLAFGQVLISPLASLGAR